MEICHHGLTIIEILSYNGTTIPAAFITVHGKLLLICTSNLHCHPLTIGDSYGICSCDQQRVVQWNLC